MRNHAGKSKRCGFHGPKRTAYHQNELAKRIAVVKNALLVKVQAKPSSVLQKCPWISAKIRENQHSCRLAQPGPCFQPQGSHGRSLLRRPPHKEWQRRDTRASRSSAMPSASSPPVSTARRRREPTTPITAAPKPKPLAPGMAFGLGWPERSAR